MLCFHRRHWQYRGLIHASTDMRKALGYGVTMARMSLGHRGFQLDHHLMGSFLPLGPLVE